MASIGEWGARLLRGASLVTFGVLGILLVPAVLLLVFAETPSGRLSGLGLAAFTVLPAFVAACAWRSTKGRVATVCAAATLAAGCLGLVALRAPPGRARQGSRVTSSRFPGSEVPPYSVWNMVPEIDQVIVADHLAPAFDPYIDRRQAQRILDVTLPIYREMDADPDFAALGTVLGHGYAEVLGRPFDFGQYYQYRPDRPVTGALIFLHGSAGNFKSYLWVLKQLADRTGLVILCPTFGFGNWDRRGSVEVIERAHALLIKEGVDPDQIYLGGISNGGIGVSRAAVAHPSWYRALIFISPVFDRSIARTAWSGKPMLVLYGGADDRVPREYVEDISEQVSDQGARLDLDLFVEEDHFLFFSSRRKALADLETWLRR